MYTTTLSGEKVPLEPTITDYVFRKMKFLPKSSTVTFTQVFSVVPQLEHYIELTKNNLNDQMQDILKKPPPNLTKKEKNTIKSFKNASQTLTIKPADKNLGIVIMKTDDYLQQCAMLLKNNTYRLAQLYPEEDISRQLTNTLIAFRSQLTNYNKKLYEFLQPKPRNTQIPRFYGIPKIHKDYNSLPPMRPIVAHEFLQPKPRNTQIPRFYGIPKIHKDYNSLPPMRPIVAHTNSLLTPTARFLDHVLQPVAQTYPDYLHNSTSLSIVLQTLQVPETAILVSVDVESLYPSIPQSECLNIIYDELHSHRHLLPFDPNLIIQLLHINVNHNYFEFATFVFQQITGTAMGAAFSPTIANIFMSVMLKRFLRTQQYPPLLLKRYIDDIFIIWTRPQRDLETFLMELNNFHTSLKYTCEYSTENTNFLDLTIFNPLGPIAPIGARA